MKSQLFNVPVEITAISFSRGSRVLPRRMEWQGQTIRFSDGGISVMANGSFTTTLSSGDTHYCISKNLNGWRLVSIFEN